MYVQVTRLAWPSPWIPRSMTPVCPDGVTNASDFHRKLELVETRWKLSADESSKTASSLPAVPQSSVRLSVFLFAGSAAAGPAAANPRSATAMRAMTMRRIGSSRAVDDDAPSLRGSDGRRRVLSSHV